MSTTHSERLVADYMRRLEAAAAKVLSPERATEIADEIRTHIGEALQEARADDEAGVRNVLERIGSPEEIVLEAVDGAQPVPAGASGSSSFGALEIAAVLVLGISGFLFSALGTIAGIVLAWVSGVWPTRDKVVATGFAGLGLVLPVLSLLAILSGAAVVSVGVVEFFILVVGTSGLGGLLGALYLAARLPATTPADRRRRTGLRVCLFVVLGGLALIGLALLRLAFSGHPTT